MKTPVILIALAWAPCLVHASTTLNYTYSVNSTVPDNDAIGLSSTRNITTPITSISKVNAQLTMTGGWSGDLYVYLTHDSGFAVLLNRPGRTVDKPFGSGTVDLSIVFDDIAPADIHTAIPDTGNLLGTFQPDAREIDPDNALDSSPRSAFLSSFNGLDANGDWTLYIADVVAGDTMTLQSWSLTITGVPEPGTLMLGGVTALFALRRRRR